MKDTLLIFQLAIQSSYVQNKEEKSETASDTLQFYAHKDAIWRIRTYSLDHDIHIHQINPRGKTLQESLEFLASSTKEHYGDVIKQEYTLELTDNTDTESADTFFKEHDMNPKLEVMESFAYWNPDGKPYENKSNPLG